VWLLKTSEEEKIFKDFIGDSKNNWSLISVGDYPWFMVDSLGNILLGYILQLCCRVLNAKNNQNR
jgi:hypothetical protein